MMGPRFREGDGVGPPRMAKAKTSEFLENSEVC
jgi:hypothetical protein